jgi:hypothetical protein
MEPLISVQLLDDLAVYRPGETLHGEYQIDAVQAEQIQAVEASVLWYSEGKGDEDLGVHYFERRTRGESGDSDLRSLKRFQAVLPNSPLSYSGRIVKIRWCVRIRLFLRGGKESSWQTHFQLLPERSSQLIAATKPSDREEGEDDA